MAYNARQKTERENEGQIERVVKINRCAKVVKGGRRFSFSALVVIGDGKGHAGYGFGKANEVSAAIKKGIDSAKKNLISVPMKGTTIPHEVIGKFGSARVLLKPAAPGTGVIAGRGVRAVLEAAGVKNILTKCLRSSNALNVVKATFEAFGRLTFKEIVQEERGVEIKTLVEKA